MSLAVRLACSALSILIVISVIELSYRFYHRWKYGSPFFSIPEHLVNPNPPITRDERLGWRATPNYRSRESKNAQDQKSQDVTITQNEHGFRLFGDLASVAPKVMVIGDSFTHAVAVSDSRTYYSVVKSLLGTEVFAYGVTAYGTLQEYMILDAWVDLIQPAVIIWQYCFNDFQDNVPELATEIFTDYYGLVRPYWVGGEIEYIPTRPYVRHWRRFAVLSSRLLYLLSTKLDTIVIRHFSPDDLTKHPAFPRAVQITDELMGKVKRRAGVIPVVAFSCDDRPQYVKALKEVSERHAIIFLEEIAQAVTRAEKNSATVKASDGHHWNDVGHRIVGNMIAAYLRNRLMASTTGPDRS